MYTYTHVYKQIHSCVYTCTFIYQPYAAGQLLQQLTDWGERVSSVPSIVLGSKAAMSFLLHLLSTNAWRAVSPK